MASGAKNGRKVSRLVENTAGKGEITSNFSFSRSVIKRLIQQTCKNQAWPCAYKTFFMLNSAQHEISKLDKSNLINVLEKVLTCDDFHCFCLLNQSFKFNLPYILKNKLSFKV